MQFLDMLYNNVYGIQRICHGCFRQSSENSHYKEIQYLLNDAKAKKDLGSTYLTYLEIIKQIQQLMNKFSFNILK